jgi:hypothetical protein
MIGLSVSAVGHATTRYITGDESDSYTSVPGDLNLSATTNYDLDIVNIKGDFQDEWYFGINEGLGLGAAVNEISFSLPSGKTYDIDDGSWSFGLQKDEGSHGWTDIYDADASPIAMTFASLAAGSYRLIVSGTGIGTSGAGKYALSIETEAVNEGGVPAVPEPETWSMLLVGTLLLGLQLRRKNAIQNSMLIAA